MPQAPALIGSIVASALGRRAHVLGLHKPAPGFLILAATDASGPGTAWIRRLCPDSRTTVLAGRHRPLRENGTRRLYLGDGCSLGSLDAHAQHSDASIMTVEVGVSVRAVSPRAE